jgi:catalase
MHIKTSQGIKNFTAEESERVAGENPDFLIQDMFEAIERGDYPTWNVYVQVMDPSEAENYRWNIFDMTKVWSHKDYPLRQIGRITLNRNVFFCPSFTPVQGAHGRIPLIPVFKPRNYFTDIEQASFSPSTMVPGIAPSGDPSMLSIRQVFLGKRPANHSPVLQARLFAYPDAARYRLGVNYQQLPTNAAKSQVYCPFQRDGQMRFDDNYGGDPNYVGSSLKPTKFYQEIKGTGPKSLSTITEHEKWVGEVTNFTTHVTDEDFEQPAALWRLSRRSPGMSRGFIIMWRVI